MIKFKNGQLKVKMLDTTIIVYSKARNVFNLIYDEDVKTLQELENNIIECKNNFKFKMSYNSKKDILKVAINDVIYNLNAILV
jgi:hypothetical protein